MSVAVYED